MQLPKNYYHCFLGNGIDAVLVGYTGSMVPDKVGVDRCNWYKSNRYYPEDKLVMVAGRFPVDKPLEHAEGSGWYEAAPLGRTWYYVNAGDRRLELQSSDQHFVPQEGTLYSDVDYGRVKGHIETWLHATRSILIERYTFDQPVDFEAWIGPGVWEGSGGEPWDTDPFRRVEMADAAPEGFYDLDVTQGVMALRLDPPPTAFGKAGDDRWLGARGTTFTKYFLISDNQQGELSPKLLDDAVALGYDALREEHLAFWRKYFAASSIDIPDEQFQYFYDASMYHFKAMQNPVSGGLPVNNLRRTWSSHVFWDSYFVHRAILEANHRNEALEGVRFFQRTLDHARRHAATEFGCDSGGLKWDWEITHDGQKAYGTLLHMKYQVHNNGSYANMIMGYYDFTQDKDYLAEFYPILEGLAKFFMTCIVVPTEDGGYETTYLVGVHESADQGQKRRHHPRRDDCHPPPLRSRCSNLWGARPTSPASARVVADALIKPMDALYNGTFFKASDTEDRINMSSITPIYPMNVIQPLDPRAISTSQAYMGRYEGQMIGHGNSNRGFPWSAGVLGAVLAWQQRGDLVWQVIEGTRPTICQFGGMTEVMENDQWNMQYFGTAEAAVSIALHQMLLQVRADSIDLFPAIPSSWDHASFENLLADGFTVSAIFARDGVTWRARNIADHALTRTLRCGDHAETVELAAGAEKTGEWR